MSRQPVSPYRNYEAAAPHVISGQRSKEALSRERRSRSRSIRCPTHNSPARSEPPSNASPETRFQEPDSRNPIPGARPQSWRTPQHRSPLAPPRVSFARMYAADPQLTASQVLRTFHHDELYLFLGAAFTTLGLMSAAFSFLQRKFDAMLFWLALFAILYGQRLWLQIDFLSLLVPPSDFFRNLRIASNYLVPIPAFFYFEAAGFLGRYGRKIAIALMVPFLSLFVGTFLFGPKDAFDLINNLIVILSLIALAFRSLTRKNSDRDFIIIRRGIIVFVAFALYDNIYGALGHHPFKEPLGFAFFLGTLGYVAAKRSLHRDHQFSEIQKELEIARRIQTSILPRAFPESAHFNVAARYVPMTAVAGDFYDFLITNQKQAGLLIADVSGHGVPAALIASMVKLAAPSQRANAADPATLLSGMNTVLHGNTQEQFVTAAYVYLDAISATLQYSAAAHPPMLLLRDGSVVELA